VIRNSFATSQIHPFSVFVAFRERLASDISAEVVAAAVTQSLIIEISAAGRLTSVF
jgi:hypothetical protein